MACFTSWPTQPKCVTHVSGTFCYLCLGTVIRRASHDELIETVEFLLRIIFDLDAAPLIALFDDPDAGAKCAFQLGNCSFDVCVLMERFFVGVASLVHFLDCALDLADGQAL